MFRFQITRTKRSSWHHGCEAIRSVLGPDGEWPVALAAFLIEHGISAFYVDDGYRSTPVHAFRDGSRVWLETLADGYFPNNLLALPVAA